MKSRLVTGTLSALMTGALLATVTPAFAQGTVDQSQEALESFGFGVFNNLYGWDRAVALWQSFTPGVSGNLDAISVYGNGITSLSFELKVYSGTGVEGALLSTTSFVDSLVSSGWTIFDVGHPLALSGGSIYTFSIENVSPEWAIVPGPLGVDSYAGGVYMQQGYQMPNQYHLGVTDQDLAFRTYMSGVTNPVPEPETYAMLLVGLGLIGFETRRRRKLQAATS